MFTLSFLCKDGHIKEQIRFDVPVILREDLGFTGLKPDNADVRIPVKKPKKKELPAHEIFFNRQVIRQTGKSGAYDRAM